MNETAVRELSVKDSDGEEIRAGDLIVFSFGIPPVRVEARIVEHSGRLMALTPGHTPKQCELRRLKKIIGGIYKARSKENNPREIEAGIFANRRHPLTPKDTKTHGE
jgi:hypothetical protein